MKITISKKEWDNLGQIKKIAQIKTIKPSEPFQYEKSLEPKIEEKPSRTFNCTSKIDVETQDLLLTVTNPNNQIVFIARTGPEARAEEMDIIDDIQAMTNKDDMEGLKRYLARCEVMSMDDKLIKK